MKKSFIIISVFVLSILLISFRYESTKYHFVKKTSTPEEIAKELVRIVSEKKYEDLAEISLTQKQAIDIVNASELDQAEKAKSFVVLENEVKEIESQSKESFKEVIEKLEKDGVVLKNIKYKTCEYKLEKTKGIYGLDLFIDVDYNETPFRLRSKGILKAKDSWRYTGKLSVLPTKNQAKMEAREKAMMDSIAAVIEQSLRDTKEDK